MEEVVEVVAVAVEELERIGPKLERAGAELERTGVKLERPWMELAWVELKQAGEGLEQRFG